MSAKNLTKFNGIKIKNIWPFYIDNINDKFFDSLSNHPNKILVNKILPKIQKNLSEDELEKFNEIDSLTKNSKIMLMLNLALKKIVSKTGSKNCDLFNILGKNKFNEPYYIKSLTFDADSYASGNKSKFDNDRKYDYIIEINNDSYLKKYISSIQLSFFLDNDIKMLSGGFSLNSDYVDKKSTDFLGIVTNIYFNSLIKHFVSKQLYPLSLENLLTIISNGNEDFKIKPKSKKNTNNLKQKKKSLNFEEITIDDLKDNWINFINRKFLNFYKVSEKEKEYLENDLFFSILTIDLVMLSLYEELRIYFTNENPEIILSVLDKPMHIKDDPNQNVETDFYELAKYTKNTYFPDSKNIKVTKIKTADDLIKALQLQKTYNEFSFGMPIFSVEIYLKGFENYPSALEVFEHDFQLKFLYMLVIFPEVFGMDLATGNFIEYHQLLETLKKTNVNNRKATLSFAENIKKTKCEFNYEFMSFVGDEPSMLIVKNNTYLKNNKLYTNENEEYTGLYENYFWAQIFVQSRLWKRIHIEQDFNNIYSSQENRYHSDQIKALERLSFSWYDDYYGMSQIRPIVNKIDEQIDLKKSIENLRLKIIQRDELAKKDKERGTILFAYIIATLIGFINFFGMVFTILTVTDPTAGLTTTNIIVISIGTIFATTLFLILIFFGFKVIKPIRKEKKT